MGIKNDISAGGLAKDIRGTLYFLKLILHKIFFIINIYLHFSTATRELPRQQGRRVAAPGGGSARDIADPVARANQRKCSTR